MYIITDKSGTHVGDGQTRFQVLRDMEKFGVTKLPALPRFGQTVLIAIPMHMGGQVYTISVR